MMSVFYETSKEIIDLVNKYGLHGAQCIICALVESTVNHHYLDEDLIIKMVHNAFKLVKEEK